MSNGANVGSSPGDFVKEADASWPITSKVIKSCVDDVAKYADPIARHQPYLVLAILLIEYSVHVSLALLVSGFFSWFLSLELLFTLSVLTYAAVATSHRARHFIAQEHATAMAAKRFRHSTFYKFVAVYVQSSPATFVVSVGLYFRAFARVVASAIWEVLLVETACEIALLFGAGCYCFYQIVLRAPDPPPPREDDFVERGLN